ncbi:MAG TPA: porin [Longimicrobiaceae bacterium]|nr:porin [Longimicrobiaceae bacterium]
MSPRARAVPLLFTALAVASLTARTAWAQADTTKTDTVSAAPTAPALKVGGVVYSQYQYLLSDSAEHSNQFDVTRAYLNLLGTFSRGISTRVTADVYRDAKGSLGYRLKYAYFQWRPEGTPVALRFGQLNTPWLDWVEGLWGFRMQGPMMLDRGGYLTSSDIGVSAEGAWRNDALNGSLAVVNGEGYGAPPDGRYKDVEARASLRLLPSDDAGPRGGLRVTGYGQAGKAADGATRGRWIGMLSYRAKEFTLAGEYAWLKDGTVRGNGVSTFGTLAIPGTGLGLVARLDFLDPDRDAGDDRLTRLIGGLSYRLSPNVRLLGDVETDHYEGGAPTPELDRSRNRLLFQTEFTF